MASSQPNAWQSRNNRHSTPVASRTPQNRSGTASPNHTNAPSQPPKDNKSSTSTTATATTNNVWAQRAAQAAATTPTTPLSTTSRALESTAAAVPSDSFNSAALKASFFSKTDLPPPYKPQEAPSVTKGSAWSKPGSMSNGQSFFQQLAKQVATLQGGG